MFSYCGEYEAFFEMNNTLKAPRAGLHLQKGLDIIQAGTLYHNINKSCADALAPWCLEPPRGKLHLRT